MSKELLRMEGITKIYGNGFMANKDVTFSVSEGEIHALIGENGAGKTTLMKILFGEEDCQNGKIYINGEEAHIANPLDAIAKGVGMVHQHFMQVPNLSVAENIMLGIEPGRGMVFDKKKAIQLTTEAAEKFQLQVDPNTLIRDLSVGYKQKVELLKALIRGVKVLILDDSTSAVDTATDAKIRAALKEALPGSTKLIIAQRISSVMGADVILVLDDGKISGMGTHEQLMASNQIYREVYQSQQEGVSIDG